MARDSLSFSLCNSTDLYLFPNPSGSFLLSSYSDLGLCFPEIARSLQVSQAPRFDTICDGQWWMKCAHWGLHYSGGLCPYSIWEWSGQVRWVKKRLLLYEVRREPGIESLSVWRLSPNHCSCVRVLEKQVVHWGMGRADGIPTEDAWVLPDVTDGPGLAICWLSTQKKQQRAHPSR